MNEKEKSDKHNRLVTEIVTKVMTETDSIPEAMVVLESIVLSMYLMNVKNGGDDIVMDAMMLAVKQRLAQKRAENEEGG